MSTMYVPSEEDFKRWIREALNECLQEIKNKFPENNSQVMEPLLSRKEMAAILRISLVTLHARMKRGLPYHKDDGSVYFLRSEVMEYVKKKKSKHAPVYLEEEDTDIP